MKPTPANIRARVAHYIPLLGLSDWDIRVLVGPNPDGSRRLSGASVSQPAYKAAQLYFDPEQIIASEEDTDSLVRHELIHVLLSPLVDIADAWAGDESGRMRHVSYINETLTTTIERLPIWQGKR